MAILNTNLISYYKDRVKEYEKIYSKPERQGDLLKASEILQSTFSQKEVLEIACGTGYWTERIAKTAVAIHATDINENLVDVARQKDLSQNKITFGTADMYRLHFDHRYESLFGGFIWSHIPLQDLTGFLNSINQAVSPGGTVVLMDNNYVEGSNHPITQKDQEGNTFQTRKLEDGSTHLVIKNFPEKEFILQKLSGMATDIQFINLTYYWLLIFKTKS